MKFRTILFYKFVNIAKPESFAKKHLELCKSLNLLGRILVSEEGINGSVSGTKSEIDKYKKALKEDKRFTDLVFKEDESLIRPFKRMQVLPRNEIIALGKQIDMMKRAPYISAKELKQLYDKKEDFIILDARNDYEWRVGKFKNAITLPIETFREFPKEVNKLKSELKGKKIVTYCTGGIRCEKASAYMKQAGFKNEIYQLKDGIITFCKEYPSTHWQGKCFVFDKRLVEDYNKENKPLTNCETCGKSCDLYRNCREVTCNALIIMCPNCKTKLNGCCSQECLEKFKVYCTKKALANMPKSR